MRRTPHVKRASLSPPPPWQLLPAMPAHRHRERRRCRHGHAAQHCATNRSLTRFDQGVPNPVARPCQLLHALSLLLAGRGTITPVRGKGTSDHRSSRARKGHVGPPLLLQLWPHDATSIEASWRLLLHGGRGRWRRLGHAVPGSEQVHGQGDGKKAMGAYFCCSGEVRLDGVHK